MNRRSRTWSSARVRRVSVVPSLRLESLFPITKRRLSNVIPRIGVISFNELNDKFRIRMFGTLEAKSCGRAVNLTAANSRY